ncbi:putative BTB/Kelch-associated [Helianthus anomalus]
MNKYHFLSFFEYGRLERRLIDFPLNFIEAIISSDVLEVRTEDVVYNFLCIWAKAKYSQSQRHVRHVVVSQLASHLRFRL